MRCRVEHLYQHIFPPDHAPTISFVGLPWKVVPFAQYELQSKWITRVLSGRAGLPAAQAMHKHIEAFYSGLEQSNIPQRCAQAQAWGACLNTAYRAMHLLLMVKGIN